MGGVLMTQIAILGSGALGCSLAGHLMDAGHHPMLVARGLHAAVMMTEGLRLTDDGGRERTYAPDQFTVHPTDGPREMPTNLDIIILSGKTHHISNLLDAVEGSTTEDSVIIPVCNGLTGAAEVTKRFGIGHLVLGSTTHGAERIAPGHVRRRGKGRLLLGSVHGEAVDSRIAMLLEIPGLSAEWDPMIRESSVRKFLLNLAINPLAAIMGSRNGALRNPEPWACMVAVIEESLPILRASGHPTPTKADVLAELATVLDATASNRCSMLQDVIRGGPTEIEALNGMIVRTATEMGIPAPLNRTLTMLIQSMSGIALGPD